MSEPTFHALLIGADHYFPNRLPNGGSYASLGGCVNDVRRVETVLRARLRDRKLSIKTLLAPRGGERPGGDEASWPTAANLRRALDELAEIARPGDQVYIHYSGHGGRATTRWKDLKGGDGLDEALVPIDIGVPDAPGRGPTTRPERYVRDVELAYYLDRLVRKGEGEGGPRGVVVTLVFDSCHSGGITRGNGVAVRRATGGPGADSIDRREVPPGSDDAAGGLGAMAEAYRRLRSTAPRGGPPARTSWLPPAKGYVLLAGCRDAESALETSVDGGPRTGVLTDAFLEALGALGEEQAWQTVYDRVLARVKSQLHSQTPQLLGETNRHVFGVDLRPVEPTFLVLEVTPGDRTVKLNAGQAMTISKGTEVGIYRPGETDFTTPGRRLAVATVVQANVLDSLASLAPSDNPAAIPVGAPAVVLSVPLRRKIALLHRADLPPALAGRQGAALDAVKQAIAHEGKGFLEVCDGDAVPHYQVAVAPTDEYEICNPEGAPLPYLEPSSLVDVAAGAHAVVDKLRRLGRYQAVLELRAPASTLADQLDVQLLVAPPEWHGEDGRLPPPTDGTPLARSGDAYEVKSDTWLWVRVTNKQPSRPVNVVLLGLDRKWHVWMLAPNPGDLYGQRYETVSEQARTFAVKMFAPIPETIDTLKLFMTPGDVDLRSLTTGARARAGAYRGSPGDGALGRLVEAIGDERSRTREAIGQGAPSAPWAVRDFRIRTFQ